MSLRVSEHELNWIVIKSIILSTDQADASSGFPSVSQVAFPHLRISWTWGEETDVEFCHFLTFLLLTISWDISVCIYLNVA
jgi:hypothetical protein